MIGKIVRKIVGSRNDRVVKKLFKKVEQINALEAEMEALSDEELRARTSDFRERLQQGESLDALLPEAFATVREAGRRVLKMRHFDVQMVGGMVLHEGRIAEMRTGEGKTLVATLAAYLNALPGKGVHVVTVNDYLAQRDAAWMGQLYGFLGMSTGVIIGGLEPQQRQQAYAADITYGTNNEFGFDYLRDNMAFTAEQRFQRKPFFAIVDEVDSILIDEARTPLIISGPTDDSTELYQQINRIIPELEKQDVPEEEEKEADQFPGDYRIDEKAKQVFLSEAGHEKIEFLLTREGILQEGSSLYDSANIALMHHVNSALRAHTLFQRDVDYIVKDNEIVIVDEFTGRTMPGRRWSEGLHQAVEAREGVPIQNENQTLASITFQNYFRLYEKLSGMTGTADTEAFEFQQIYGLEVIVIPTNREMTRDDMGDLVYLTAEEKFDAVTEDIRDCIARGQPVLVGTASIETSEIISAKLQKAGIEHKVLNAKHHEQEAHIIAQAGRSGSVTIATNMAGRGTDIVLGGSLEAELAALPEDINDADRQQIKQDWEKRHEAVLEAGGLHVIGTERHESRRVDNQLRGRSGRQGDAGSTRFYLSLQDSLMRIFASDRVSSIMQKLGMQEGEAIEHPWVTRAIENAQKKVEGRNFDIRKQLLEYDDVANDQRKVIYEQRNDLMETEDVSEIVAAMRHDVVNALIDLYVPPQSIEEQWDIDGLSSALENEFGGQWPIAEWLQQDKSLHEESLREKILQILKDTYAEKESLAGSEVLRHFEKAVLLQTLDSHWKEHLAAMDYLRQGIGLRGYAQKNPKQEYKREAFAMFSSLLDNVKNEVISVLSKVPVQAESDVAAVEQQQQPSSDFQFMHEEFQGLEEEVQAMPAEDAMPEQKKGETFVREQRKVGRNEPCPCGSGKKYKQCHGKLQ